MTMIHLFKKEFLLIKRNILWMSGIIVLLPILITLSTDRESIEGIGLVYAGVLITLLCVQYLSLADYQFPKGEALLATLPYSKKQMILARYSFCFSVPLIMTLLFALETQLIAKIQLLSLGAFISLICIITLFLSVYLPVQYRFGYEKTRFIFLVSILVLTLGSNVYLSQIGKVIIQNFATLSDKQFTVILLGSCIALLGLSIVVSIKIYENKDF